MQNHFQFQHKHHFKVHGGDAKAVYGLYMLSALIAGGVWGGFYWLQLEQYAPSWVWLCVVVVGVLGVFWWSRKGAMHRYEIQIDLEEGKIYAMDHKKRQQLWEDEYHPDWVRGSEIQVIVGGQVYRYPALIYASEPVDLIIDGVPTNNRILLSFGEKTEVDAMVQTLQI